jgi:hypothetical protein
MRFSALTLLSFGTAATCYVLARRHGGNLVLQIPELNLVLSFPLHEWNQSFNSTIGMGAKELSLSSEDRLTTEDADDIGDVCTMYPCLGSVGGSKLIYFGLDLERGSG